MNLKFCYLEDVDSTNLYAQSHLKEFNEDEITVIYTYNQTKGKGQIGKTWFSGISENLCFSLVFFPKELYAADSFKLLMSVSLALRQALAEQLGVKTKIKWPNDIYYKDQKIAGILIQNGLKQKKINSVVAGMGLNVNTHEFPSELPNPISLSNITNKTYALEPLLMQLAIEIGAKILATEKNLMETYMSQLYRLDKWADYKKKDGQKFEGKIKGVEPDGCLNIEDRNGKHEKYNFHEIVFL